MEKHETREGNAQIRWIMAGYSHQRDALIRQIGLIEAYKTPSMILTAGGFVRVEEPRSEYEQFLWDEVDKINEKERQEVTTIQARIKPLNDQPILLVEDRPCGGCAHFMGLCSWELPVCQKLLMTITRTMRVTYKEHEGTCFTEPERNE